MTVTALTAAESREFQSHEKAIERGLRNFMEVGAALAAIRAKPQFYQDKYGTFEAYCRERWNMQRAHAYRLIDGAKVAETVSPIGDTPTCESQVRPLAKIKDPQQRKEAWKKAVEKSNGNPTAKDVEAAVIEIQAEHDGSPYTGDAEFRDAGRKLTALRLALRKIKSEEFGRYLKPCETHLRRIGKALDEAVVCECPACDGARCIHCGHSGLVNQERGNSIHEDKA